MWKMNGSAAVAGLLDVGCYLFISNVIDENGHILF